MRSDSTKSQLGDEPIVMGRSPNHRLCSPRSGPLITKKTPPGDSVNSGMSSRTLVELGLFPPRPLAAALLPPSASWFWGILAHECRHTSAQTGNVGAGFCLLSAQRGATN